MAVNDNRATFMTELQVLGEYHSCKCVPISQSQVFTRFLSTLLSPENDWKIKYLTRERREVPREMILGGVRE